MTTIIMRTSEGDMRMMLLLWDATPGNRSLKIVEIPIKVVGSSPGVKEGGKLLVKVRKVKVKTIPENLKDTIEVDITPLKLGQSFKVRDIKEPNFEILNSMSIPLVSVEITRALKSAATDAAKAEASAKKK